MFNSTFSFHFETVNEVTQLTEVSLFPIDFRDAECGSGWSNYLVLVVIANSEVEQPSRNNLIRYQGNELHHVCSSCDHFGANFDRDLPRVRIVFFNREKKHDDQHKILNKMVVDLLQTQDHRGPYVKTRKIL